MVGLKEYYMTGRVSGNIHSHFLLGRWKWDRGTNHMFSKITTLTVDTCFTNWDDILYNSLITLVLRTPYPGTQRDQTICVYIDVRHRIIKTLLSYWDWLDRTSKGGLRMTLGSAKMSSLLWCPMRDWHYPLTFLCNGILSCRTDWEKYGTILDFMNLREV